MHRDSILQGLARVAVKKKSGDGREHPVQLELSISARFESRITMTHALRMNAMLVALLATASAINGIIFYNFL